MVQIIPRFDTAGDRFARAFGGAASSASQLIPEELMKRREQKRLSDLLGFDVSDIRDPKFLEQLFEHSLSQQKLNEQRAYEEKLGGPERQQLSRLIGKDVRDIRNPDFLKQLLNQEIDKQAVQEERSHEEQGRLREEAFGQQERDQLARLLGQDISNIRNPDLHKLFLQSKFSKEENAEKRAYEQQKLAEEQQMGLADYDTIKKHFGEDIADLYKSFSTGGKTRLVNSLIDSLERREKFSDLLEGAYDEGTVPRANLEDIKEEPARTRLPDYTIRPKGFSKQEWAKERSGWIKSNTESLDKARDKLKGNKRDILGTKKLQKLNDSHELPEGLGRWIINPKTGEPYGIAQLAQQAPTAAQEWVKEIARFGNRAKDAYGSRVTNFDLAQYMKQFPTLLNTPEGRRNILKMMEINYELDSLYDKSVQKILDEKGAGNIPPAEVDRVARAMIKDREEQLFTDYLNIENENESSFMGEGTKRPSLEEIFSG